MTLQTYLQNFGSSLKTQEYTLYKDKKLFCLQTETESSYLLTFLSDLNNLTLHWGIGVKSSSEWLSPLLQEIFINLPKSVKFDSKASQTDFYELVSGLSILEISFKKDAMMKQINFVVKKENSWYNNNGKNYAFIPYNSKNNNHQNIDNNNNNKNTLSEDNTHEIEEFLNRIIGIETSDNSWTLMHRFNLCNGFLSSLHSKESLAWIFVWMRYSALRKLTWQRKFNTKPSELAHSQKNLSLTLTKLIISANSEGFLSIQHVLKLIMGVFGKGGDNGQKIRDQILEIMHRNHINESSSHFYEQWHQKLHNNTTPDDIGICEAVIAFNKTNKMDIYWETLQRHGITKERLASFERPIKLEPFYAPDLVSDLTDYLETLSSVHSGNSLIYNVKNAYRYLGSNEKRLLDEIIENLNDFDKIKQMERGVSVRKALKFIAKGRDLYEYREILYLDMSLEGYIRQIAEAIIHLDIPIVHLNKMISFLLENLALCCEQSELNLTIEDWNFFSNIYKNTLETNKEHSLILKSIAERLKRVLAKATDQYITLFDEKAKYLGNAFKIDQQTIGLFSEEIVRGSMFFSISLALKKLDHFFKKLGLMASCNIISNYLDKKGVFHITSTISQSLTHFNEETILFVNKVSGEEEIPINVVGIISSSELDVLSHISIRARNSKSFLLTCQDEEIIESFKGYEGQRVGVLLKAGQLRLEKTEEKERIKEEITMAIKEGGISLEKIDVFDRNLIVLKRTDFSKGKTGNKSLNCAILKEKIKGDIGVPESLAFPYGFCEFILEFPENKEKKIAYEKETQLLKENPKVFSGILKALKDIITQLTIPNEIQAIIEQRLKESNVSFENNELKRDFFNSLKRVWASKFNDRAYLNTLKSNLPFHEIKMSVLCQEIIPASYAFVLHTKNPITDNKDEIYGEVVVGMGETLVGSYEGRAFSFVADKKEEKYEVISFMNKSVGIKGKGIILRSDSNCEDLEGFAGAGLFDSIMVVPGVEFEVSYKGEGLMVDEKFRWELMRRLKEVGVSVEKAFGGVEQDIEGVVKDNKIYLVQARPQI